MIKRSVAPNGVRVLTESMPEAVSASLGFWIGVGSRDEPDALAGSSHFLEHLLFKGTERHSALEIAEVFDAIGGETNAFSTKEYTCVHGRVLAGDLELCCDYLADMVCRPSIRTDEVDSERKVVLEEIAMRDDTPDDLIFDLFAEDVFGSHPLGRAVLGTVESVGSLSAGDVAGFHRQGYHSANVVVAAAGRVDHDQLLGWISDLFPGGDRPALRREPVSASPQRKLNVVQRDSEQVHLLLGGLGYSRQHPDRFAWETLDVLLGGGMSSRLFQEIREQRGLAYAVYSYRDLYQETGMYGVYAGTMPANTAEVLQTAEAILDKLAADGPTPAEVDRAKGHLKGSLLLALEDGSNRMTRLGKSELVRGEILTVDELVGRMDAVTLDDVARVAAELFRPESRVLTVVGPAEAGDLPGW